MKIRAPFQITRERFAEHHGEVAFVLQSWVHGTPNVSLDPEEAFRRGFLGVMFFLEGRAVYHLYGGLNRRGEFIRWDR